MVRVDTKQRGVVIRLPGVRISILFVAESIRETYISMEWSGEKNDVAVISPSQINRWKPECMIYCNCEEFCFSLKKLCH